MTQKGTNPIKNLQDVDTCLEKTAFPAKKSEIFTNALHMGVNMNVITLIQSLSNKVFTSPKDVFHNLGFDLRKRREYV